MINKKNIKIKVNNHLSKLAIRSKEAAVEALTAIRLYKTETSAFCGKAYEYINIYTATNLMLKKPFYSLLN